MPLTQVCVIAVDLCAYANAVYLSSYAIAVDRRDRGLSLVPVPMALPFTAGEEVCR